MASKERELLRELVSLVDTYNQPDMLDGYLNDIGERFNNRLEELDLPTIFIIDSED